MWDALGGVLSCLGFVVGVGNGKRLNVILFLPIYILCLYSKDGLQADGRDNAAFARRRFFAATKGLHEVGRNEL